MRSFLLRRFFCYSVKINVGIGGPRPTPKTEECVVKEEKIVAEEEERIVVKEEEEYQTV